MSVEATDDAHSTRLFGIHRPRRSGRRVREDFGGCDLPGSVTSLRRQQPRCAFKGVYCSAAPSRC